MEFTAEIKRTGQIKRASLDNEYQLLLVTDDANILDLGKLPSDVTVTVSIKVNK